MNIYLPVLFYLPVLKCTLSGSGGHLDWWWCDAEFQLHTLNRMLATGKEREEKFDSSDCDLPYNFMCIRET